MLSNEIAEFLRLVLTESWMSTTKHPLFCPAEPAERTMRASLKNARVHPSSAAVPKRETENTWTQYCTWDSCPSQKERRTRGSTRAQYCLCPSPPQKNIKAQTIKYKPARALKRDGEHVDAILHWDSCPFQKERRTRGCTRTQN